MGHLPRMGKQARIKRDRALQERRFGGPPMNRTAFQILRSIHKTIQDHCHENSRRCWEYMVEMLAMATDWHTESNESEKLWEPMHNEPRWTEYAEAWIEEVTYAKENRVAFSEPIGELLEFIEGANHNFGQYFTPMSVIRACNEITFCDLDIPEEGYVHGLDPCCGTGRFMLDALVFNERLIMGNIDLDLWLQRAAKLNARILARWTTLREPFGPWDATLAGRARFIWGDALVVDTAFAPNWLLSWYWTPQFWQNDLKIMGFPGTYEQWLDAGKPNPDSQHRAVDELQFDYSMEKNSPPPPPPTVGQDARSPVRKKLAGNPFAKPSKRSRAPGGSPRPADPGA